MTAPLPVTPWTPGDEIRKARRDCGWEQDHLAELIGVVPKTISRWENGHGQPTIGQWRRIALLTGAHWMMSLNGPGGNGPLVTYSDGPVIVENDEGQQRLDFELPPSIVRPDLTLV